jgi:hypothetical protein
MMGKALLSFLRTLPLEAFLWAGSLLALALTDPNSPSVLDLCLFKYIGVEGCPGCGLGHSVAYLLDGHIARSFETHPLGPFAVGVLCTRILSLVRDAARSRTPQLLS